MRVNSVKLQVTILVTALCLPALLQAQLTTGTILGRVNDATGSVMSGVGPYQHLTTESR
jgi:hypothetical protein